MNPLVFIAFFILIVIIQAFVFLKSYKKPSPGKALIVHGKMDPSDSVPYKIYTSKPVFVWPVIQQSYFLELDAYSVTDNVKAVDLDHKTNDIKYGIELSPDKNNLDTLVSKYFGKQKGEIEKSLQQSITLLIEQKIAETTIDKNKSAIIQELKQSINEKVEEYGFQKTELIKITF